VAFSRTVEKSFHYKSCTFGREKLPVLVVEKLHFVQWDEVVDQLVLSYDAGLNIM